MSIVSPDVHPTEWTIADVQAHLPGFPANRILVYPTPGTATEEDVLAAEARTGRICELIDGTLVEKIMATKESMLAGALIHLIHCYLDEHPLGAVTGEAGLMRILPGQVRAPDVAFIRWERLPGPGDVEPPIYACVPNLAVEIISPSNTKAEMDRKLRDYFDAGVSLVWYIDPAPRTARAYTAADQWTDIGYGEVLYGGEILPGFELPLAQLFARAERPSNR